MPNIRTYQPILEGNAGPICTNPNAALQDIILTLEDNSLFDLSEETREIFCMLLTDGLYLTRLDEGTYDFFGVHKIKIAYLDEDYVNNLPEFPGY